MNSRRAQLGEGVPSTPPLPWMVLGFSFPPSASGGSTCAALALSSSLLRTALPSLVLGVPTLWPWTGHPLDSLGGCHCFVDLGSGGDKELFEQLQRKQGWLNLGPNWAPEGFELLLAENQSERFKGPA